MKKNSSNFINISGSIILIVFITIAILNITPRNNQSNSYYVKVNDEMSAKIEGLEINDGKLVLTTSGTCQKYCVKTTKSNPADNAICWKEITNNTAIIPIYEYKKYYVWIKDDNNNISIPMSINKK